MKGLNRDFAEETLERLARLEDDRMPSWGSMSASDLIPHLIGTLRFSLKQIEGPPYSGNWLTTTLAPPVAFTGWLSPPKNLRLRGKDGAPAPLVTAPGDLAVLESVMGEFIDGLESGSLSDTAWHPLFGDIRPHGWAKFHVLHTKHHLKQFRL